MRPRTKTEEEVVKLSQRLRPLTEAQRRYALEHCTSKTGYKCKSRVWCSECGHEWIPGYGDLLQTMTGVDCPFCGAHLNVEISRRRKDSMQAYFSVITKCGGYQVIRTFFVSKGVHAGREKSEWIGECVQNWVREDGKNVIMARSRSMCSYRIDEWNWTSAISVKKLPDMYHEVSVYSIFAESIYPRMGIIPKLKRNGFNGDFHCITPVHLFTLLLTEPKAETLYKAHQYSLLGMAVRCGISKMLWKSIRICIRNHYVIEDASMWKDYISLLEFFDKDTLNAKYVCPSNLKAEHDRMMKKKMKVEQLRHEKEQAERIMKQSDEYERSKSRFFSLCMTDGEITVTPLKNVDEFREEGDAMRHCVFTNEYFAKDDSLIMSARDKLGHRLETIEVSLKSMDVVQSRAVCNGVTEYHDRIISLVRSNMEMIRRKVIS